MPPDRVYTFTFGFLRNRRVRRIMTLAGYQTRIGLPSANDMVAIWGRRPVAARGRWIAKWRKARLLTVEDGLLRSVLTGREGEAPLSLVLDRKGIYFDCSAPSDLEDLLNSADLGNAALLKRARDGILRLQRENLSKYNAFDPALSVDETDYVLVVDQTKGDASIKYGGADGGTFKKMLQAARAENPDSLILIKTHPEVIAGTRAGHYSAADLDDRMVLLDESVSPWRVLQKANKVYCVSSLMGFEAILAGHRPVVFGKPFYGGWGLTDDRQRFERRHKRLQRDQLFAAVMLIYVKYYDPYRDCLCEFETALDNLASMTRAYREDRYGYIAFGMRLWKRRHLRRIFGSGVGNLKFGKTGDIPAGPGRRGMVWAGRESDGLRAEFTRQGRALLRLEDGFLRSNGLGADLVPPMSLVLDDLGIYYDPRTESRLERLLNASDGLEDWQLARAERLRETLIDQGLSKYNMGDKSALHFPPNQHRILVVGQVEDDASIIRGTREIRTNLDLLRTVRARYPKAFLAYKPHPDVEAGLRKGKIPEQQAQKYADMILTGISPAAAIEACDQVCTMTSLLGFEALLRGKKVTCFGVPFYAGWGLTNDEAKTPGRRQTSVSLDAMIYAVLIEYPRYFDPQTGLACPVEVVVDRLKTGDFRAPHRGMAKLQGMLASCAPLWRR